MVLEEHCRSSLCTSCIWWQLKQTSTSNNPTLNMFLSPSLRCASGSVVDQNQPDLWPAPSPPLIGREPCQSYTKSGWACSERHQARPLLGHDKGTTRQREIQVVCYKNINRRICLGWWERERCQWRVLEESGKDRIKGEGGGLVRPHESNNLFWKRYETEASKKSIYFFHTHWHLYCSKELIFCSIYKIWMTIDILWQEMCT